MPRDLAHRILPKPCLAPAARTNGTVNGTDIDTSGYESATALVHFGTWTDGTHTAKLQEADDNGSGAPGTYADVAAAGLIQAFSAVSAAPGSNTVQEVGYIGGKRWIRLVMTTSGATTGALSGGLIVLSHARNLPA
jgi:hypothetical protein